MWRFYIHDTMAGTCLIEVFPSAGSWTRRLNGQGSGSHTFVLTDVLTGFDRSTWRSLLAPNARTLSVFWDDTPIYAGVILKSTYNRDSRTIAVDHSEIRTIMKSRLTFGVLNHLAGDLTITNKSGSGAVRAITQRAVQWSSGWNLPIVHSADGAGTISKAWKWYQVVTIEDCLGEIEKEGWEIDFFPTANSSRALSHVVRVGKPITGGLVDYNLTADAVPVTGLSVVSDGASQLTGVFVTGNGTGADIVTAWAGNSGSTGIPIRDSSRSGNSEQDVAALTRIAEAYLDDWDLPVEQWSFSLNLSGESPLSVRPGERVKLITRGDPWALDADRVFRVVALSGDMSLTVKPEVI